MPNNVQVSDRELIGCIRLEQGCFVFDLDERRVLAIVKRRDCYASLSLPAPLVATIQRAAFLDLSGSHTSPNQASSTQSSPTQLSLELPLPQSGLTFLTYYEGKAVLRSVVGMDGDMLHQVCRNILDDQGLTLSIAHHWLIHQLLGSLQRSMTQSLLLLSWILASIPVGGSLLYNLAATSSPENRGFGWILSSVSVVMAPILQRWVKARLQRLLPQLRGWIVSQLFSPHRFHQWLIEWLMGKFS